MATKAQMQERLKHNISAPTPELPSDSSIFDRLKRAEATANVMATGFSEKKQLPTSPRESVPVTEGVPYFLTVQEDQIDENPFNARRSYSNEKINKMSASLATKGQLTPGIATIRNGRYVLAAGHYRLKGLRVANIKTMDLMVHEDLTDQDLYQLSFAENNDRNDQSALDNALAWRALLDDGVYSSESSLSQVIGIPLPTINKTLQILTLPEDIIAFMNDNDVSKFGMSPLYELVLYSKIGSETETLKLAEGILRGDISRDGITAARRALENPKIRKQKEISRQYKLFINSSNVEPKDEIGHIKEFGSGKILLEVNVPDEDRRKKILEALAQQFTMK